MNAPISPTGGCPDPAGRGARIRVTYGITPTVHVSACLADIDGTRQCCHLPRHHDGSHLALPAWPRQDITRENPSFQKEQK